MKEKKERYNISMTPSIMKELKKKAEEEGLSVSSKIETLVRKDLKKK
jgi:hypothetical protein